MCRLGITLLPEAELVMRQWIVAATGNETPYADKEMPTPEALAFLLSIFESRREGHQRVKRDFHREDDFYVTEGSRRKDDFLVPGVNPPRRSSKAKLKGQDLIRHVGETVYSATPRGGGQGELELPLFLSPMRTPLDQVLVEGVFRKGDTANTRTINQLAQQIAPALIDGIDVDGDSQFVGNHLDEFRHFLRRLGQKFQHEHDKFPSWLRQEREKGFLRLLPGFKRLPLADREAARDEGKRFFRRVLWTAHEAMSRCFGVTALHLWMSFCQSELIRPSPDEQRAFRFYHAPLVLAAGMPLWFFGTNVLRWVMDGFIDRVWGWNESQDFDPHTTLICLYGTTAHARRRADANKKRMAKVAQNRPDLLAEAQEVQYEKASAGQTVAKPIPTVLPAEFLGDVEADYPGLPPSGTCSCGGRLVPVAEPSSSGSWVLVDTECAACGQEQTYRLTWPS
jgi:hypothetical protein